MSQFPPGSPDSRDPLSPPQSADPHGPWARVNDRQWEAARRKVAIPAIILMVLAVIDIGGGIASPWLNVAISDTIQQWFLNILPDPEARREFQEEFRRQQEQSIWNQPIVQWTMAVISVIIGSVMLFGAIQMYRLNSFGWALTAAILAIIPFGDFCCCIELPIGVWALIVVLTDPVKSSFG